jgi:16S rRNA (guanine(527)-N(7))-methyltransferase RsmG
MRGKKDKGKPKHHKPVNKHNRKRKRSPKPTKVYMIRLFESSGMSLSWEEYDKLWQFHKLLRVRNDELDLTRIRRFEDYVIKHYVDSTIIPSLVKLPESLLDIGTGAGLPGIPLKIVSPKTHIILGEPRWKRCKFMREAIEKLELKGIEVYEHKVFGNFPHRMGGVITRAVESILKTLKRSLSFLELGGKAIFMKGPSAQPEVEEANRKMSKFFEYTEDIKYTIKGTPQKRRLIIYTKIKHPADIPLD